MFVNLVRNDDKEIAFRRPHAVRSAILLILISIDCLCYFMFAEQIRITPVGTNEYVLVVPMLAVVLLNYKMAKYGGPDDLVLDLSRHTYTKTLGYPFFPRKRTGSFGDFYGLCVRTVKNRKRKPVAYRVELDWNNPELESLVLAEAATMDQALDAQHELAIRLATIPIAKD